MTERVIAALAVAILAAACSANTSTEDTDPPPSSTAVPVTTTTTTHDHGEGAGEADPADVAAANLATAAFQDVAAAEAAGYASTIADLGCFQSADEGGMGLHYLNGALMDDQVDITTPEALVYELDSTGQVAGLVAHEYIVPVEAWTNEEPPSLFGVDFHEHPTLPLWVLHAWIWRDNPSGMFNDWNPKVRMCPDGVPIFGVDLP